jgi:hypothetical protein
MFGYSAADWLFIGFILVVVVVCIGISDLLQKKK